MSPRPPGRPPLSFSNHKPSPFPVSPSFLWIGRCLLRVHVCWLFGVAPWPALSSTSEPSACLGGLCRGAVLRILPRTDLGVVGAAPVPVGQRRGASMRHEAEPRYAVLHEPSAQPGPRCFTGMACALCRSLRRIQPTWAVLSGGPAFVHHDARGAANDRRDCVSGERRPDDPCAPAG